MDSIVLVLRLVSDCGVGRLLGREYGVIYNVSMKVAFINFAIEVFMPAGVVMRLGAGFEQYLIASGGSRYLQLYSGKPLKPGARFLSAPISRKLKLLVVNNT